MKQSFADWSSTRGLCESEVEMLYRSARAVGYQAVEMAPPHRWAMAKEIGLRVLNIAGPGMQSGLNRLDNHPLLLTDIEKLIATAHENDIQQIIVFTGNRAGQRDEDGIAHTIAALRHLAPVAQASGVTLLLELLCQSDHPDYQADRISIGAAIARGVDSSAVKVLYDIYHMHAMGADPMADIVKHLDCIGHLHVAAAELRGVPREGGAIDYPQLIRQVRSAGYVGWWGQEFLSSNPVGELTLAYEWFARPNDAPNATGQ